MGLLEYLKLHEAKKIQDLNGPETTLFHRRVIREKPFLKSLYTDFYRLFKQHCPDLESQFCVELGSGGGFIKEILPTVLTSDVVSLPDLDYCFSVLEMPFKDHAVDAFFMFDVFHHVSDSHKFLAELARCLKPGGKVIMIEPANTLWARFIYQNFHHEDFDPGGGWGLKEEGRLSSANGALPWIVFRRDYSRFQREFPQFRLLEFQAHTPLRYLVSGGVSMRALLPAALYPALKALEGLLSPLNPLLGMHSTICLQKA